MKCDNLPMPANSHPYGIWRGNKFAGHEHTPGDSYVVGEALDFACKKGFDMATGSRMVESILSVK